jgi:hypothetical protein
MTRLDIIQAIMAGAGISQLAAIKVLNEHDESVRAQALANTARRDEFARAALQGMLCCGKLVAPEELARRALKQADLLMVEIDK